MNEELKKCNKCGRVMSYDDSETWWDYSMVSYDVKLIRCPHCGEIQELICEKVDIDINNDSRYFY